MFKPRSVSKALTPPAPARKRSQRLVAQEAKLVLAAQAAADESEGTESEGELFSCTLCDREFKSLQGLRGHGRVHSTKIGTSAKPSTKSTKATKPRPVALTQPLAAQPLAPKLAVAVVRFLLLPPVLETKRNWSTSRSWRSCSPSWMLLVHKSLYPWRRECRRRRRKRRNSKRRLSYSRKVQMIPASGFEIAP